MGPIEVWPAHRNKPVRCIHLPYPSRSASRANTSPMGRSIVVRPSYRTVVAGLIEDATPTVLTAGRVPLGMMSLPTRWGSEPFGPQGNVRKQGPGGHEEF